MTVLRALRTTVAATAVAAVVAGGLSLATPAATSVGAAPAARVGSYVPPSGPSFNNPLGCTMPDEKKLAVLDLLARHDVPLIEDDIYGDICFGPERPKPFIALDRRGNTIYCSSFSKTVAPGYRIGWVAGGRYLSRILDAKAAFTLCGSVLPQAAFAENAAAGILVLLTLLLIMNAVAIVLRDRFQRRSA